MGDEPRDITQDDIARLAERTAAKEAAGPSRQRDKKKDKDQLINVDEVKRQIRQAFTGEQYQWVNIPEDADSPYAGKTIRVPVKDMDQDQLCNETCIQDIFRTLEGHLNTNVSGSYLSKQDVERMGIDACLAVAGKLYIYQDKYDINGPADAHQIISIVKSNVKAGLKKAYKGRLLKHSESTREIRTIEKSDETEQDKKGGRFPLPF